MLSRCIGDEPPDSDYTCLRSSMVDAQIRARGIRDKRVLAAMKAVPRHVFVPPNYRDLAYSDGPLPIGKGQTISQPYVVAAMTTALESQFGDRILEIGTGSGYQTAVLCEMGLEVFSIECVCDLAGRAASILSTFGYTGLHLRIGDGYAGWPEAAPFDGIIVTAAPEAVPPAFLDQLNRGGRLVIPVGSLGQDLRVYRENSKGQVIANSLFPVRFVSMVRPVGH